MGELYNYDLIFDPYDDFELEPVDFSPFTDEQMAEIFNVTEEQIQDLFSSVDLDCYY